MLILSSALTQSLLDPDALRQALASAMVELSAGRASMPSRIAAYVKERGGFVAAMPAYLPAAGIVAAKLVSLYPGNAGTALPMHQAIVALLLIDEAEHATRRMSIGKALLHHGSLPPRSSHIPAGHPTSTAQKALRAASLRHAPVLAPVKTVRPRCAPGAPS